MHTLESFLFELQTALRGGVSLEKIEEWGRSPLLQEHELLQATYACLAQQNGLKYPKLHLERTQGGAIPLFGRGFFPWKSLPYPKEHAELGLCLAQLGDRETACAMARYQNATLDHTQKPVPSLFLQEGFVFREELEQANRSFFEAIGQEPAASFDYADPEIPFLARRCETSTLICTGSGCKSGLGVFLHQDAGIVNWGPQTTGVGNCDGFGLAGRAKNVRLTHDDRRFSFSFQCHLAKPSGRDTGFAHLQDTGYSARWIEATLEGNQKEITCTAAFHSARPAPTSLFTFFGKGRACWVSKLHKLHSNSLDRYQGPPQGVTLAGAIGKVSLEALEGVSRMEIIPLAGDDSFWGADFLIAYTLQDIPVSFKLQTHG